jgi:hypothetical protein
MVAGPMPSCDAIDFKGLDEKQILRKVKMPKIQA